MWPPKDENSALAGLVKGLGAASTWTAETRTPSPRGSPLKWAAARTV